MQNISVQYTRANLAEIIDKTALTGEQFVVTKFGKPKVAIVPLDFVKKVQEQRLGLMYRAINKLEGLSKKGPKDLSQSIDDILYVKNENEGSNDA